MTETRTTTDGITVPAGHLHQAELIARGWTSSAVKELLAEHIVKIDVPQTSAGVSNKAYPVAVVEQIEAEDEDVREAVRARAERIPPTGAVYTEANTTSRDELVRRGWTAAHIERLLGKRDYTAWADYETARYGQDRAQYAEEHDAKLRRRLQLFPAQQDRTRARAEAKARAKAEANAIVAAEREAARKAAYDAAVERNRALRQAAAKKEEAEHTADVAAAVSSRICYVKVRDEWMLAGPGLVPGETVTVTKRDGSTKTEIVGRIAGEHHGQPLAGIGRPPRLMVAGHLSDGDVIEHRGSWVTVTRTRSVRIDSDDPSVWGSHLLGEEDSYGTLADYRPATPEEAAPRIEAAAEAARERDRIIAQQRALLALRRHVDEHGTRPERPDPEAGDLVFDSGNRVSGTTVRVAGETIIWIEWHGMDGDDWYHNNCNGGRLRHAPLDPELVAALTAPDS